MKLSFLTIFTLGLALYSHAQNFEIGFSYTKPRWGGGETEKYILNNSTSKVYFWPDADPSDDSVVFLGYPNYARYSAPLQAWVPECAGFIDSLFKQNQLVVKLDSQQLSRLIEIQETKESYVCGPALDSIISIGKINLNLREASDHPELGYVHGGTWKSMWFEYIDSNGNKTKVSHSTEFGGSLHISPKDIYVWVTFYLAYKRYPDLFKEVKYADSYFDDHHFNQVIFDFLRWSKQEVMSDGRVRKNIEIGCEVEIVEKHNQRTGELTSGFVDRILTKSPNHPHGIKVRLETGEVGRVKTIIAPAE